MNKIPLAEFAALAPAHTNVENFKGHLPVDGRGQQHQHRENLQLRTERVKCWQELLGYRHRFEFWKQQLLVAGNNHLRSQPWLLL